MRRFNTAGPVRPDEHYCVPPREGRIEREYALGSRRVDLLVIWPGAEWRPGRFVVECKLVKEGGSHARAGNSPSTSRKPPSGPNRLVLGVPGPNQPVALVQGRVVFVGATAVAERRRGRPQKPSIPASKRPLVR